MTPTERLRELLDERGVEWKAPASYDGSTKYDTIVGDYWFHEYDGRITVHGLTPEQAIAATLGRGTCHPVPTCNADETDTLECVRDDMGGYCKKLTVHVMECTECGHTYEHVNGDYEFCPRCGRKRADK